MAEGLKAGEADYGPLLTLKAEPKHNPHGRKDRRWRCTVCGWRRAVCNQITASQGRKAKRRLKQAKEQGQQLGRPRGESIH